MLKLCYPNLYVSSFRNVELDLLKQMNIKGLILDIDNTLVATSVETPDGDVVKWIEKMKYAGIKLCIVSNASMKRVKIFNDNMNIHSIHRASKPSKKSFVKAANIMGLKNEQVAVIGDQIFCDILGGNITNMYTILVKPISKREFWFVKLKRFPERIVLASYRKTVSRKEISEV